MSSLLSVADGHISIRTALGSVRRAVPNRLAAGERTVIEAALVETKRRGSASTGAVEKLGRPPSTLESKIGALKINTHRFKEA
jgi:hypothetical protein